MVKTKDELLNAIKEKFGDDTSDETISLIEDISDTMSDYETRVADTTNWKNMYEENDKNWRNKYKERFFNSDGQHENEHEDNEDKTIKTFEDLFTVKEN